MPVTRGVLYIKWGDKNDAVFQRSLASLRRFHPDMPAHVVELPPHATLLEKANMLDFSEYDETLFLDTDTIVMGRLDFGFEKAAKFGLACCICECPWARRYGGLSGDLIEYNTGVLFFTKLMKPMFDSWKHHARTLDSSIIFKPVGPATELMRMPLNDQGGFAMAVEETGTSPFVLPMNWNLRYKWQPLICGPIKIWHDYAEPPAGMENWNQRQGGEEKVIEFTRLR